MRRLMKVFRSSSVPVAMAACLGVLACGGPAQAANLLEKNFWLSGPRYDGDLPPCESALGEISYRFAEKESKFWNSDLQITGYEKVRELAYRPWPSDSIPRRFCTAHALMNDGHVRQVHYSIIEDGGFAGYGSGVDFCVVGLDRDWAFNPACKAAKP
jgi:hypothetical protein